MRVLKRILRWLLRLPPPLVVVTPEFIERVLQTGALAQAMERARLGTARPRNLADGRTASPTWTLVCEEIVDTTHDDRGLDDIVAELERRGFSHHQIQGMRRFAWKTAGWLNYELMLWEWCVLGEDDIRRALRLQLEQNFISPREYEDGLRHVENPGLCADSAA